MDTLLSVISKLSFNRINIAPDRAVPAGLPGAGGEADGLGPPGERGQGGGGRPRHPRHAGDDHAVSGLGGGGAGQVNGLIMVLDRYDYEKFNRISSNQPFEKLKHFLPTSFKQIFFDWFDLKCPYDDFSLKAIQNTCVS